ncbi:MAG: tRNA-dihydrouridine synthase family protein [Oscillospiraceae bacterium]|nr:tRNA-dihydrouridine synthase family protein [Oscillospiraceae bacterium]
MEGLTRAVFRARHCEIFGGADRYFTPFITPGADGFFSEKELREIRPEDCGGAKTVPQLLTAHSEHFLWAARNLAELGYSEVNLNLGCPSGTVVAKHKGSGMLADLPALDRFFNDIFEGIRPLDLKISVKTRIGLENADSWGALLEVFNRYPICELTVHPRLRKQFYKGKPDYDSFALALGKANMPLCYNGDIFSVIDAEAFKAKFPAGDKIMLGRGLIANPALARQLRGGSAIKAEELRRFHDALMEDYLALIGGQTNVMHKMKELWSYWDCLFPQCKKELKELRKAKRFSDYRSAAAAILAFEPNANGAYEGID